MTAAQTSSASKFLSLVLRQEPSAAHVTLDSAGWVEIDALLAGCAKAGRAATRFLDSIRAQGLLKMERRHIHLSAETRVTKEVGARYGKPVQLTILAGQMQSRRPCLLPQYERRLARRACAAELHPIRRPPTPYTARAWKDARVLNSAPLASS